MPEPNYGQNADLAAERDAILALPPDQMQQALLAFSQRRSGVPEIPGGYRNAEFAADLPAPTGRFAANIVPGAGADAAKSLMGKDEARSAATGTGTTPPPESGSYAAAMRAIGAMPEPIRGLAEQGITNRQRLDELAGQQGQTEQRVRTAQARGEADAQRTFAEAQRTAAEQNAPRPIPAFVPTQDTAADMGTLFSLLAVAGQALGGKGKTGAMTAMASMTGMLNGWRQGRQDLYEKERRNFDASLRQIQAQNQALQEAYRRAQETARTDMESARSQLQIELTRLGAPLVSIAAERAGLEGGSQQLQQIMQVTGQVMARKDALQARAAQAEAQLANQQPLVVPGEREGTFYFARRDGTPILRPDGQPLPAPPPKGSAAGSNAVQFRYNAAVSDAAVSAATDIQNVLSMPGTATPPLLGSFLTEPGRGVTPQLAAYMGQRFTSSQDRAMQQAIAGLTRSVTTIQAAGRPGGVTQAALADFARTAPQPGDARINYYMFFAMLRQEMDLAITSIRNGGGTPEQLANAQAARDRVYAAVPYSVTDITRILSSGRERIGNRRTNEILQHADRLREAERQLRRTANSPEERQANEVDAAGVFRNPPINVEVTAPRDVTPGAARAPGQPTATPPAAPAAPETPAATTAAPAQPEVGATQTARDGKTYRFRGGNAQDRNNWEVVP
jgi:hypothetical protein